MLDIKISKGKPPGRRCSFYDSDPDAQQLLEAAKRLAPGHTLTVIMSDVTSANRLRCWISKKIARLTLADLRAGTTEKTLFVFRNGAARP